VGLILARRLGWHFLDSGALYRVLGVAAERAGQDIHDSQAMASLAQSMTVEFEAERDAVRVLLNGRDVGDTLRTEDAGRRASVLAAQPAVRAALLDKQRAFRRPPGLVADGRDMGTTVFPDAVLKVFLTASPEARAERRYKQLKDKGFGVNLPRLLDEIRERDARDAGRSASPLKPAEDAYSLDTTSLSIPQVIERIADLLRERGIGVGPAA
jgi:cytidylate kinase